MLKIDAKYITTMAQSSYDVVEGTPWEEIGVKLSNPNSIETTLQEAGLDWSVLKRAVWTDLVSEQDYDRDNDSPIIPKKVTGNYVLLRDDTMEPVSSFVGTRYKPVQNDEAFKVFRDFCEAGNMQMETAGSLVNGQHVWGLAKINGDYELTDGEYISGYFLLMQSHVYGSSLKALFTPIRYPGGHTMVQAMKSTSGKIRPSYTMPHSRHFNQDRIKEIQEIMGLAEKVLVEYVEIASNLTRTKVSEADTIRYFIELFHPTLHNKIKHDKEIVVPTRINDLADWDDSNRNLKKVPELLNSYAGANMETCAGTAWGLVQASNHFYDHQTGNGVNTRLVSAWMGPNAKKKLKALHQAQKLKEQ